MLDHTIHLGSNFTHAPCPICGATFSKCGLPNHIRRHSKALAAKATKAKPGTDPVNRRSPAWWDGWKEGYKLGVRDGSNRARKKTGSIEGTRQ